MQGILTADEAIEGLPKQIESAAKRLDGLTAEISWVGFVLRVSTDGEVSPESKLLAGLIAQFQWLPSFIEARNGLNDLIDSATEFVMRNYEPALPCLPQASPARLSKSEYLDKMRDKANRQPRGPKGRFLRR